MLNSKVIVLSFVVSIVLINTVRSDFVKLRLTDLESNVDES